MTKYIFREGRMTNINILTHLRRDVYVNWVDHSYRQIRLVLSSPMMFLIAHMVRLSATIYRVAVLTYTLSWTVLIGSQEESQGIQLAWMQVVNCLFGNGDTTLSVSWSMIYDIYVCMTLSGDGRRLQTCGGLTAQLFDSTLRTFCSILCVLRMWRWGQVWFCLSDLCV
jgi:hypothetical protein